MMKNVYLLQPSCLYGNNYYLPYAIGMLAAYAFSNEQIKSRFSLQKLVYRMDDIDETAARVESPAVIGFSNYMWNYEYNLLLAEKLKAKYPDCLITFGGHHLPNSTEYLEKYSFIDVLSFGKGEESFEGILLSVIGQKRLDEIPNIAYRDGGRIGETEKRAITLSDYPSPYLTGVFDDLLDDGYDFSCVLETNRGCPFRCAYCDWGEINTKVRLFPLERVFAELEWMSRNKIEFVYCVDANFGLFERDLKIAEKLVELKETTGYPNRLQVSYAKNEFETTFRISVLLQQHGIGKGATLSLQSLEPAALRNVSRSNISAAQYRRQLRRYREANVPTYTELILGLPGETLESFEKGLCQVIECGQHNSVTVYNFELLPGSEMAKAENMAKHGIRTVSNALFQYHCKPMEKTVSGYSNIVVGTSSMTVEEWIEASLFGVFVQVMHHFGLTQCLAMAAVNERGVSYYDFYKSFYDGVVKGGGFPLLKAVMKSMREIYHGFVYRGDVLTYYNEKFGEITYPPEEAAFLMCLDRFDDFYDEVRSLAAGCFSDEAFAEQLLNYQKAVVVRPGVNNSVHTFDYDFKSYFESILLLDRPVLQRIETTCTFFTPFATDSLPDYARQIIWYGRRNGRMMYSNKPNQITITKGKERRADR